MRVRLGQDLEACRVPAVQMNVLSPCSGRALRRFRRWWLHRLAGWSRPIFTDSGGFQVYSLIRQNPRRVDHDRGATFRPGGDRKYILTPEKSIQLQFTYGSDMFIASTTAPAPTTRFAAQVDSGAAHHPLAAECKKTLYPSGGAKAVNGG